MRVYPQLQAGRSERYLQNAPCPPTDVDLRGETSYFRCQLKRNCALFRRFICRMHPVQGRGSLWNLRRRTVKLRRPERARNEGSMEPKRLDDAPCPPTPYLVFKWVATTASLSHKVSQATRIKGFYKGLYGNEDVQSTQRTARPCKPYKPF